MREVGGAYSLSDKQINNIKNSYNKWVHTFINEDEKTYYLSSARGAIRFMLENLIDNSRKNVLIPNYTCDSVIKSFRELGYNIGFYIINSDMTICIDDLLDKIEQYNKPIIYLQSYFGFDTLLSIRNFYPILKNKGCILVEDITHSFLSAFSNIGADFYIVSLRKWLEIPDGAALIDVSSGLMVENITLKEHKIIINDFILASSLKNDYLKTKELVKKNKYRFLYKEIDEILDVNQKIYRMSNLTHSILIGAKFKDIEKIRCENFSFLLENLDSKIITPVFNKLPENITPLYFEVRVNGDRHEVQQKLAQHDIYCPIHWPIPCQIEHAFNEQVLNFQMYLLSIPCDQRYDTMDMKRIVEILNKL